MTKFEVLDPPETTPLVQLLDGAIGMLLIWPIHDDGLCGTQVHGEEEHRWIHHDDLRKGEGFLFEANKEHML